MPYNKYLQRTRGTFRAASVRAGARAFEVERYASGKYENMKNEIIELEERLRQAMLNSNVSELDELISPELLFTNHLGVLVSKKDDLSAHSSRALMITSLDLSDSKILVERNAAVVSVRAEIRGSYNGQPANGSFRFTRFWSNTSGKWQVIAGHSSVIA